MAVVNWRQKVGQLRSASEVRAEELCGTAVHGMHNRTSVARKQDVLVIVVTFNSEPSRTVRNQMRRVAKPSLQLALLSPRTTKKQEIAVGVLDFETTQTVVSVLQWLEELDVALSKFCRECVRIRNG